MIRRLAIPLLAIALANGLALGAAAWNRGARLGELELTERELAIRWPTAEETGTVARLQVRQREDSAWAGWVGAARLAALGFDTTRLRAKAADTTRRFDGESRLGWAVLELDGETHAAWVREERARAEALAAATDSAPRAAKVRAHHEREIATASRLWLVDAGPDPVALQARYPAGDRYLVMPAIIRVWHTWVVPTPDSAGRPSGPRESRLGVNAALRVSELVVPRQLARELGELRAAGHPWRVRVAIGRRHEPWVTSVEDATDGEPPAR